MPSRKLVKFAARVYVLDTDLNLSRGRVLAEGQLTGIYGRDQDLSDSWPFDPGLGTKEKHAGPRPE
jgi:hypothetical protein